MLVIIWACWYVISRWGVLGKLTPADITLLRYLSGTLFTLPMFWWLRGRPIPWWPVMVLVLTYGFPYALTMFLGLQSSPAANAGVLLNGLLPIASAGIAWCFFRQSVSRMKWVAISVLMVANFMMLAVGIQDESASWGWLWIIAATMLLAIFMNTTRKWYVDVIVLLPLISLGNLVLFLPIWWFMPKALDQASGGEILVQVIFQGIINQILVVWLMVYTIKKIGSVSTSVLFGFVPAATAVLGWLFLHETLHWLEIVAIAGCTVGIVVYSRAN